MLMNNLEVQPFKNNERFNPHSYKSKYYCLSDLSVGV